MSDLTTRVVLTSDLAEAGRVWIPWKWAINKATEGSGGASTTLGCLGTGAAETVAKIGKNSAEFGLTGIGCIKQSTTETAEFSIYIGQTYFWDLTKPIYIDLSFYVDHAQAAADDLSCVVKYLTIPTRPSAANSLDKAVAIPCETQPTDLTVVATDLAGIVEMTGCSIKASSLTNNNNGLVLDIVATTLASTTGEFAFEGLRIRYTRRAV
jgi:hypothetical protein